MRVRKLFNLAKGNMVPYLIVTLLIVFHQLSYSFVPLFTQYLIDRLSNVVGIESELPNFLINIFSKQGDLIMLSLYVGISLLFLQVIRFTTRFFEMWNKGLLHEKMSERLRIKLYDHIQNLDYRFHNTSDTGDLIQRVTSDVDATTSFLSSQTMEMVYLIMTVTIGAYRLYNVNPLMVLIAAVMIVITAIASVIYFTRIDKVFQEVEKTESKMITTVQENLSASKVVRAFANENFEIEKMEEKNLEYTAKLTKANKMVAIYWGIMDSLASFEYLAVILIGIYSVRNGTMSAGMVISALMFIGMLIWPVRGLGRIVNDFGKAVVAADRINHILEQKSEYDDDGNQEPNVTGKIEFNNVSFKFPDTDEHLLKNVSFTAEKGETIAIIGRTGSGKSTIVNLLLRMYDFNSGDILVDGVSLKDIKKKYIRNKIGVVLQEPFLYSKTVFENIAITNKQIEEVNVYNAAKIASLEKDIDTFQKGYETLVGEKGTTLSGGQKQRVAIARVLVDDRPILVFDDALSAVDTKTDLMIRDALAKKEKKATTIIITHRITTAKEADKIVVLNNGVIEEIGTHDVLSKKEGLYKKLWGIQGKLEKEFLESLKVGE